MDGIASMHGWKSSHAWVEKLACMGGKAHMHVTLPAKARLLVKR